MVRAGKNAVVRFAGRDEVVGVNVAYDRTRRVLLVDGWYDAGFGAFGAGELSLGEFLTQLGITHSECLAALGREGHLVAPATLSPGACRAAASFVADPDRIVECVLDRGHVGRHATSFRWSEPTTSLS